MLLLWCICMVSFASCRTMHLHNCMSHPNQNVLAIAVLHGHGVYIQQHARIKFSRDWLTSCVSLLACKLVPAGGQSGRKGRVGQSAFQCLGHNI